MKNSLFRIDKNSIIAQDNRTAGIVVLPRLEDMMQKSEAEQKAPQCKPEESGAQQEEKSPLDIEIDLKKRQLKALSDQIEMAKGQADRLLQEAAMQADKLKEKALQDGYRVGYEKAVKEANTERAKEKQALSGALQSFACAKESLYKEMEESVLDLAIYIAEYILKAEIRDNGNVFKDLVRNTLVTLKNQSKVIVKLSKDEYERFFSDAQDSMVAELRNSGIQIVLDISLQSGDCMVETDYGYVNVGVKTQLNRLEYALKHNWTQN